MPKLYILKSKQVLRKFEKLGFVEDRQAGSHDLPKGTLAAILRESKISKDDFINA